MSENLTAADAVLIRTAHEFAEVFSKSDLASDVGELLTCMEVEVLAGLLTDAGRPDAAARWLKDHARGDDEGDAHWELNDNYTEGEDE